MYNRFVISAALLAFSAAASAQDQTPDELVFRALSGRHAPTCAEVEALTPTPVATLLVMVDQAQQPPWVPMRAAECLALRHHGEIRGRLDQWVVDPDLRGFGLLVINRLDDLPLDLARDLANRAVSEGPEPEKTRERLRRLKTPELVALGNVAPTPVEVKQ